MDHLMMRQNDDVGLAADGGFRVAQGGNGRRTFLVPLLLALGLFALASLFSKYLAPRGVGGRPDDNDIRWARTTA